MTYFCPALDPPLGGSGRRTTAFVRNHKYFIPTKFREDPPSGSREKTEYVFSYMYMHVCTSIFEQNKCLKNSLYAQIF